VSAPGAGSAGANPSGADGSGASAAVTGPALEDSSRVEDPRAGVVEAGVSWRSTALAALTKLKLVNTQVERSKYLLGNQRQTYNIDFFLMALFIRTACRGVSTAGGRVSPANGAVPAMAMVTATVADGAVSPPSGSAWEEEAEGLQEDIVSTTQYQYIAIQQSSELLPGRFEFLRLLFAHQPTALRHQRQSAGQLHALLGGVVPTCFSFSSLLRLGAHILDGSAAAQSCSNASPLCLNSGTGEEVVRPGDVGSRRVAAVQLCVSLQKVLQLSNGVTEVVFNKKKSNTHRFGRISCGKQCWHIRHGVHV
jgi:hypothetical protein